MCRPISPPTVTPVLSGKSPPHGRAGGFSPLSPTAPSIGISSASPQRASDAFASPLQPVNSSMAGQASSTPKTTAQDLLNNVMGLGRPPPKTDAKTSLPLHFTHQQPLQSPIRHHQRLSSSSQLQTLFSGTAGPSIWSAAPGESALGLSPRNQASGTLPASPLSGLAPLGHPTLHTAALGVPSTVNANVYSSNSSSALPAATSVAQELFPPYDHVETMLPTHINAHLPPVFPASVERDHRHISSSSVGVADAYAGPGYEGSVVYASSPRQAPLPSHPPDAYSAQQTLTSAFNSSMVLSSTIDKPQYQSMTALHSSMPHSTHTSFGLPKYGGVRQQRAGGVWGDAG